MCHLHRIAPIAACALLAACSSGDGGTPTGPAPSITLSVSAATLTVTPGQDGTVTVSITRSNGYTGAVSLALEGAPQGVSGSFAPAQIPAGGTTSTLTLTASAAAAAGAHSVTIRASGAGVDARTASVALTITPAPSFTLALDRSTLELARGSSGTVAITVQRTNFTGAIMLAAAGAPPGVTATPTPASLTGGTATLTIDVGAATAPGRYPLSVTARATGLTDRTAAVELVVTAPALTIATPQNVAPVVGAAFTLALQVNGPGPHAFSSVGAPLPGGLTLNAATGEISGTPTVDALLTGTPAGDWAGVVIRVGNGTSEATTQPFTIAVRGAPLPAPYAYMPFDGTGINDAFGRPGTAVGPVVTGQPGAIAEAVRVGGTDVFIRYPASLSSQLNGRSAFTLATTFRTTSTGTMFFNLSDQSTHWTRAYAGLDNGRIEMGGRSRNRTAEPYRAVYGTTQVNDGQFHTLVGVMDLAARRISIFIDGRTDAAVAVPFSSTSFETFTPADQNVIGHITTIADTPTAPTVTHDEVALWDVALDAVQAATVRWLILRGTTLKSWIGF